MEIWKIIPGHDAYEVSDLGRVRRRLPGQGTYAGRPVLCSPDKEGYRQITLCQNAVRAKKKVHALVLLAFVGPVPPGARMLAPR